MPSNNSNGNTFDFQGRQLSCKHLTRRVVRYEHDGSITLIADKYNGKRLNSPNDVVPHPDAIEAPPDIPRDDAASLWEISRRPAGRVLEDISYNMKSGPLGPDAVAVGTG